MDDDPKKLLRCACGHVMDFTSLLKCARCGKARCVICAKRFRKRPYCKPCMKQTQREESRNT